MYICMYVVLCMHVMEWNVMQCNVCTNSAIFGPPKLRATRLQMPGCMIRQTLNLLV